MKKIGIKNEDLVKIRTLARERNKQVSTLISDLIKKEEEGTVNQVRDLLRGTEKSPDVLRVQALGVISLILSRLDVEEICNLALEIQKKFPGVLSEI